MLYIVTPLSRIENLTEITKSFKDFFNSFKNEINWIIIVDKSVFKKFYKEKTKPIMNFLNLSICFVESPYYKSFVGHSHRNYFLNYVYPNFFKSKKLNNWLYFLDDDTLLHPDFLETIIPLLNSNLDKAAIIFDQENKDGSMRLFANINSVKVCHIDMGQYVINLSKIPTDLRFKEDDYCADGIFIEELFKRVGPEQFLVINKTLSTYNKLR